MCIRDRLTVCIMIWSVQALLRELAKMMLIFARLWISRCPVSYTHLLWCGSLDVHFDDIQLYQIACHLVRAGLYSKNASEETKKELSKLIDFANKFHRVEQCGEIKREEMTE